ncbi:MAG: MFS transporter [Clostridiales Family XIII bacterium]|jgi:predicted MFS family arabinose efflux permease|nr:MFS transporter [Clostridiales Family XIII bacterium]
MKSKSTNRIGLFYAVVFLFWFGQFIYVPFLSPYMRVAGISGTMIGVIAGAYGLTQMMLRIPLSIGGWKSGSHKVIIGSGLAALFLSCMFPLFSESWIAFLLVRALSGVASASWISYSSYVLEGAGSEANKRMGYLMTVNTGGICASQLLGTLIYGHVGLRMMFVIGMASAALALVLFAMLPMKSAVPAGERRIMEKGAYRAVLTNKNLWLCALLMAVGQLLHFSTSLSFSGVYAQEALGASPFQLGLVVLVGQLATMAISISFGKLERRGLTERFALTFGFLLFAAYAFIAPSLTSATPLIIAQVIAGTAGSLTGIILFANAGRDFSDDQQILAMGLFQTIYSIGITGGPILTGAVLDLAKANYGPPFYVLGCFGILGAVIGAACYRSKVRGGVN